jgi:hypothetical protein
MRSARRRALAEKKKNSGKFTGLILKVFLPLAIVLGIFAFFKFSTRFWNGHDKFAVAYRLGSGDVAVSVLDPKLGELTTLTIPGDTQVDVARNYGELRIKNVWQLGVNEKFRGALLAETITQNFLFPTFLWSDSDAKALADSNVAGILHFMFFPKSTNIAFGDRVSAGIFALRTGNSAKNLIDLGKNQFLVKQKLNDGLPGYVVSEEISPRLSVYFSDNTFTEITNSGKSLRVSIKDATNSPGVADKVGQIIEVLGGKVISVDKVGSINSDCTVFGADKKVTSKIADLFSCKTGGARGVLDIEVDLGTAFAKRF